MARLLLSGGPDHGVTAADLPRDVVAPVQIVWGGWLYEWHGQRLEAHGFTFALVYEFTGRHLAPDEIPPLIAETVEMWADGAEMIARVCDVPAELLWPGL